MTPVIYTAKGHLPIEDLNYRTEWQFSKGEDGVVQSIVFVEEYRDGAGEIVKRSAHVYDCQGTVAAGVAADIGG